MALGRWSGEAFYLSDELLNCVSFLIPYIFGQLVLENFLSDEFWHIKISLWSQTWPATTLLSVLTAKKPLNRSGPGKRIVPSVVN